MQAPSRWRGLVYLGPNRPVLLFGLGSAATEALLQGLGRDTIYKQGGIVGTLGVLLLLWMWLTVGWGLWWASVRGQTLMGKCPRIIRVAGFILLSSVVVLIGLGYMASWGVYLKSGRFPTPETVPFIAVNFRMIWLHLWEGEPWVLWALLTVGGILSIVVPCFFRRLSRCSWEGWSGEERRRSRLIWYSLTIVWLLLLLVVTLDHSMLRRDVRLQTLAARLNPLTVWMLSGKELLFGEPIEPCLDKSQLKPITTRWTPPDPDDKNRPCVVFLAIESLRDDVISLYHQGREVMPHLNRLTLRGLHLRRLYAQSSHSDYADVSVYSSLYPLRTRYHHIYRKSDPWPITRIYDLLKRGGYATAIISSQNERWGGMDAFLASPHLDFFYDARSSKSVTRVSELDSGMANEVRTGTLRAGKLDDRETIDVAVAWLRRQAEAGKPFFLGMNLQSSHFPYLLPADVARPFQPCHINGKASFVYYPREVTERFRNAYFNALHHIDRQIGRLVDGLREAGVLEQTILVIYGDNGESFHENDRVTHAQEPFEAAIHVAGVIHAPRYVVAGEEDYPLECVDLAPTVFGLMGWPRHPNFQGIDGLGRDRLPLTDRLLFFHTENPLVRTDAVMLAGRWKLHHDRQTGRVMLYDLAVDPGESHSLANERLVVRDRLMHILTEWRKKQLAYYHFPFYYQTYYPPPPPHLGRPVMAQR